MPIPIPHFISGNTISNANYGRYVINGVDERARNIQTLDEVQRNAIDFYAQLRSLFRQHRAAELRHGEPPPLPDLDTLYRDPAAAAPLMSQVKPPR